MVQPDYKFTLERVFHGPMDLLLHLVREQEVEIHEIQVGPIVDGYLAYLNRLPSLDLEVAGDFLVMAATLMTIKSRALLPGEEVDLEEELDPRDELIQRLIEYRRFREASENLGDRFHERTLLHGRGYRGEVKDLEDEPEYDLSDLTAWDLLGTYARLLRETGGGREYHVQLDERPMRFYVDRIVHRLRIDQATSLSGLIGDLDESEGRDVTIGCFCALLELVKLGVVEVDQDERAADIDIRVRPEHREDIEAVVRATGFEDELEEEGTAQVNPESDTAAAGPEGGDDRSG